MQEGGDDRHLVHASGGQHREERAPERNVSTLEWRGADSGLCFWQFMTAGTLQSAHTLSSVHKSSRNTGTVVVHFPSDFGGDFGRSLGEMLFIGVGLLPL